MYASLSPFQGDLSRKSLRKRNRDQGFGIMTDISGMDAKQGKESIIRE
jgi:hypothetical protein